MGKGVHNLAGMSHATAKAVIHHGDLVAWAARRRGPLAGEELIDALPDTSSPAWGEAFRAAVEADEGGNDGQGNA